jgi:PadR family transcriptional regulator PadR
LQPLDDPNYWKSLINIGLSKFFVLKILYEKPSYGYEITKKLNELTAGCCAPTSGTIYPILAKLTKEGYTRKLKGSNKYGGRERKIYALTSKGKKTYKIALDAWRSTLPYIYKAIDFEYVDEEKDTNGCYLDSVNSCSKKVKKPN